MRQSLRALCEKELFYFFKRARRFAVYTFIRKQNCTGYAFCISPIS